MSMTDTISDLITRIRNAHQAHKKTVECLHSKMSENVLKVLKEEGYITAFHTEEVRQGIKKIIVELRYVEEDPAIKLLKRVSKPGRRVYYGVKKLPKYFNGLGISVLSTSRGVLSDHQARQQNIGGELLFYVF